MTIIFLVFLDFVLGKPAINLESCLPKEKSEVEIHSNFGQCPVAEIIPNALIEALSDLI